MKENLIMACIDKRYQKSAVRTYNSTAQTVTADLTQLNLLGSTCTDTGCSLTANGNNIQINNSGLYYLEADVTFTPTAAGAIIVQMYNGSNAIPCAIATDTAEADNIVNMHVETVLCLNSCCACRPQINVKTSGVAGSVNFVGVTAFRLA
jgi:hypothetical protein